MRIGEVCLLTSDVVRLSNFYKALLGVENNSNDNVHQFILAEETSLTVYNDGTARPENHCNIQIAFTVEDVDAALEKVQRLGAAIAEPPTQRPWGAKNMSFFDPDGNLITFRSFPKKETIKS